MSKAPQGDRLDEMNTSYVQSHRKDQSAATSKKIGFDYDKDSQILNTGLKPEMKEDL